MVSADVGTSNPPTMRPYQEAADGLLRAAWRRGKRAPCLVLPTGGGKTVIFSRLIAGAVGKGLSAVVVAPRIELLTQAREKLLAAGVTRVGILGGGHARSNAPVQVASIQTLCESAELHPWDVVVFDEGHHYAAAKWLATARRLQARAKLVLGVTATPERGDGVGLGELFDELIVVVTIRELQDQGHLVRCIVKSPGSSRKELAADPFAAWHTYTPGQVGYVYTRFVAHAQEICDRFAAEGIPAAVIHGDTDARLRAGLVEAHRTQSRAPLLALGLHEPSAPPLVLCNAGTLIEGVDNPRASVCILAGPCSQVGGAIQRVGRVLRPDPSNAGKVATVLDLTGVWDQPGFDAPEADRQWSLEGEALKKPKKKTTAKLCPACETRVSGWRVDKLGWRFCPQCGEKIGAPEPLVIAPRDLRTSSGSAATSAEQTDALTRLARLAAARGYKPGFVAFKFREKFGAWPRSGVAVRAYEQAVLDQGHPPPVRVPVAPPVELSIEEREAAARQALADELARCG